MQGAETSPRRLLLMCLALAAALVVLGYLLATSKKEGAGLPIPLRDFVEYWAAGQLLAGGENPHDPVRIAELETQAGRDEKAILMWNPPWTLPFVLPLGWMPVPAGHIFWLLLQLAALV